MNTQKAHTAADTKTPPVILTIATSDSGGGAGVQADIKTITALGGFATSVFAALTAQNGAEVRGVHDVPVDFIALQLETVLDGFPVKAAKMGMLSSASAITMLAKKLQSKTFPLVIDPVCVSQSGYHLLHDDAVQPLRQDLIPLADLFTPNKPEAELLAEISITGVTDVEKAIARLLAMGAQAVLLKGGHFEEYDGKDMMVDWLGLPGQKPIALPHPRIETNNNHGTGCTLSAALATYLGLGCTLHDAVGKAQNFLTEALAASFSPGIGAGPPNIMFGK